MLSPCRELYQKHRRSFYQLVVFGIIGIAANIFLYIAYRGLTHIGAGHKTAATVTYIIGTVISFLANKRITFKSDGPYVRQGFLFTLVAFNGYLVNILGLYILVDRLGYPDKYIQAIMIFLIAAINFTLLKIFVFKDKR